MGICKLGKKLESQEKQGRLLKSRRETQWGILLEIIIEVREIDFVKRDLEEIN